MAQGWHPLHDAIEPEPGVWVLRDSLGREHSRIRIVRIPDGPVRFRVEHRGALLGWATTLREACVRAHREFLHRHTATPFTGYPELAASRRAGGASRRG